MTRIWINEFEEMDYPECEVEFEVECIDHQPAEEGTLEHPPIAEYWEYRATWDKEQYSAEENRIIERYCEQAIEAFEFDLEEAA